jgi:hypothetical protein
MSSAIASVDKALVEALACGALAMCLQNALAI